MFNFLFIFGRAEHLAVFFDTGFVTHNRAKFAGKIFIYLIFCCHD